MDDQLFDDTLCFAQEEETGFFPQTAADNYKLLIVDDENEVHAMTKLVLDGYQYMGKGLDFISAYTADEAKEFLLGTEDIACCLLDVVMETNHAGLELAKYIRERLGNTKIRIILRTGQPGQAPEKDVILNYDINDYKQKTELTDQKLYTSITTALRSYMHLCELDEKNQEINHKNIRLNDEIARRIVAESNLTKYNKTLEQLIETKTKRIKEALTALEQVERQLFTTQKAAIVSDISSASLQSLDASNKALDSYLHRISDHLTQVNDLAEIYFALERTLEEQSDAQELVDIARQGIEKIKTLKNKIEFEKIAGCYPDIVENAIIDCDRMGNSISDIKRFVAINNEVCETIEINQIIEEIRAKNPGKDKSAIIEMDLQSTPIVPLPKQNLTQAIEAVIENAVEAIEPNGNILIDTRYEAANIYVHITDTGSGIPQHLLSRIFSPYFSAWPVQKKGLGLSFAKSVALSCEGDITISSTENKGTKVTLKLPCKRLSEIEPGEEFDDLTPSSSQIQDTDSGPQDRIQIPGPRMCNKQA